VEWAVNKAKKHPKWTRALEITANKPTTNLTKGATHFESIRYPRPKWAKDMIVTAKIGNHVFYKTQKKI
jgi:spore germination cell wall hydrolase CwlJ-like protein